MEFLLYLQEIRTPFLNDVALFVSLLCDKILIIAIFCYLYWCVDKRYGYGLGLSFVLSGLLVQGIKITARVERPFINNPDLKPSKAALETATGYSFPSGHTQTAASLLGYTAFKLKGLSGRLLCFVGIFLVMLSRMMLGVHTPLDVSVSFVITILIAWLTNRFMEAFYKHHGVFCSVGTAVSVAILFLTIYWVKIGRIPYEQASDCFVICICGITFFVCWFIENKFVRFNPSYTFSGKNKLSSRLAKYLPGMAGVLIIYTAFEFLGYLKYAAVFFWICCGYPMIIKRYGKGK